MVQAWGYSEIISKFEGGSNNKNNENEEFIGSSF
jgi:hypothetical protein